MRGAAILALCALCLVPAPPSRAAAPAEEAESTRSLYLLLIRQARADGRPRAALAYLADFERKYPGEVEARILKVNCLLDLGQSREAQAVAAQLPGNAPGTLAVQGHVLAAQGSWAQAADKYRLAMAASPADPLIGNALGYAQLRGGDAAGAVETLKGAADLAPADPVIRNNLMLALTMSGRTGEVEAGLRGLPEGAARTTLRRQLAAQAERLSRAAGGS